MENLKYRFVRADKVAIPVEQILSLYHSLIGQEGCTWSVDYPDLGTVQRDYKAGNLYCLLSKENDLIGAVSVCEDPDIDDLACWSPQCLPAGDVMRVAVAEAYQNHGLAREMLTNAMDILRERGFKGIHFLVSKNNARAIASYQKLNFVTVGEVAMYDKNWWCYERKL